LEIRIEPRKIMDTISLEDESRVSVRLYNLKSNAIVFDMFRTECSCTRVEAKSMVLYPNDSLSLDIIFRPYGKGIFEEMIRLITNDLDRPYFIVSSYYVK